MSMTSEEFEKLLKLMTIDEFEKLHPTFAINWEGKQIVYATPNKHVAWRAETLSSKEPDTIAWIASFEPGDVLLDVGANVGMYTIWAAATRDTQVIAFEPESQNYALLNANILWNGLGNKVTAYCTALSDEIGFDKLHLSGFLPGGSCHNYGEKLDYKLEPLTPVYSQGCNSTTLDAFIAGGHMPVPKHIKIDVDGIEHKVIKGAGRTLEEPALESVLVELNTNLDVHRAIVDEMRALGFSLSQDQLNIAIRTEGPFK
jgi:FkbM family methyltransferase